MRRLLLLTVILLLCKLSWSQDYWSYYTKADSLALSQVTSIAPIDTFDVWLGAPNGLAHFQRGVFTNYTTENSALPRNHINDLAVWNNALWIATDSGLTQFANNTFIHFTTNNGLPSNRVKALDSDGNGNLWIGTDQGVSVYNGGTFVNHLKHPAYWLLVDADDQVWVIDDPIALRDDQINLHRFDGNTWTDIPTTDISPISFLVTAFIATKNSIYLSSSHLGYFQYEAGAWITTSEKDGLFSNEIWALTVDEQGAVWTGQPYGFDQVSGNKIAQHNLQVHSERINTVVSKFGHIYAGINYDSWQQDQGFAMAPITVPTLEHYQELDANNIRAGFNAKNRFFTSPHEEFRPRFEITPGSGIQGLFSANLWISAKSPEDSVARVAASIFNGHDFAAGSINDEFALYRDPILKLSRNMIQYHRAHFDEPGYATPAAINDWPANGNPHVGEPLEMARFVDVNNNGYYDPFHGDYPVIRGDQAVYFIMNDARLPHTSTGSEPIGLEVHTMAYAFNRPADTALHNTIFLQFDVINRSERDYDSVKVGFFNDYGHGNQHDNFIGCDSALSLFYVYNGDDEDEDRAGEKGFGLNPPVIGCKMLQPGLDNYMRCYNTLHSYQINRPETALDYTHYLNSRWRDGSRLVYEIDGEGYDPNPGPKRYTNYFHSGDPVANTGWTEGSAANTPFYRAAFGSFPYFSLQAGERKSLHTAVHHARGDGLDRLENVTFFKENMHQVQEFFDTKDWEEGVFASEVSPWWNLDESEEQDEISETQTSLFPNPSNGVLSIRSNERLKELAIYNLQGQLIETISIANQFSYSFLLPTSYRSGTYLVKWTAQSGNTGTEKLMITR